MPQKNTLSAETISKRLARTRLLLVAATVVLIAPISLLFFGIQLGENRDHAFQTAEVVAGQVEHAIENNEQKKQTLTDSLKEDYTTRAKAVSYIADLNPQVIGDVEELQRIANLVAVDEIHLFDDTGTIFAGTNPAYYGYSFESGAQIGFFKPMLNDKALSMCQDITPNTAESKSMMYAICWNDAGTRMTQIGIEPVRLLAELRTGEISELVESMPSYEGLQIVVADASSGEIEAATNPRFAGLTLEEVGIDLKGMNPESSLKLSADVGGMPCYCTVHEKDGRIIVAAQDRDTANEGLGRTMIFLVVSLLIAAAVFTIIIRRLTSTVVEERVNASTDKMTGFHNRRAYEEAIAHQRSSAARVAEEGPVAYVAMDLNGLKLENDLKGHAAGDELIKNAAACMRRSFGSYGDLYRIGGDEFAAVLFVDETHLRSCLLNFDDEQKSCSAKSGTNLSVSCGSASTWEFPDKSLAELAKVADERMYEAKKQHYHRPANAGAAK